MRKIKYKIMALILIISLFSPVAALLGKGDSAGENGGTLRCETNLQLIPQSGDVGGGNIKWHLEGEAASEFRTALAESVGNQSLYPSVADENKTLSRDEVALYLGASKMLESYLQKGGELRTYRDNKAYSFNGFTPQRNITPDNPIHFYGVKITRSSLNTDSITEDTKGLVGSEPSDTSPIDIHYKISFHSGPGTKEYNIDMDDTTVASSIWDSFIMPHKKRLFENIDDQDIQDLKDGVDLDHSNLLEREGEVQGIITKTTNLFNLSADHKQYLQEGDINETFRTKLNNESTALNITDRAVLSVEQEDVWRLTNPLNGESNIYYIENRTSGLKVYLPSELLPEDEYRYSKSGELQIVENVSEGDHIDIFYAYSFEWKGNTEYTHWSFVVGTNSFYSPDTKDTFYLFRTPAGEVLYYSTDFKGTSSPGSTIKWDNFNVLENPQILFVIIFVFGYYTATMPKKYFEDYREGYHAKYQKKAEKNRFIHLGGKLLTVALVILYFVPTFGPIFVNGPTLIVLSIAFMVLSILISKVYYSGMKSKISDEYKTPPENTSKTIHTTHTVKKPTQAKQNKVKQIYCDRCGEVFTVPKERNLLTIKCPVCGDRQRKLKEGYNYLLVGEKEKHSYSLFKEFMTNGLSGLVLTTTIPSKIRERYDISERKIKWISDTSSEKFDVVDPTRLEFDIVRAIKNFAEREGAAVILLDDIDYLVTENGFGETIKSLKKITDTTSMHAVTFLVHIDPHSFSKSELSKIKKKFDNIERFSTGSEKNDKKVF